jgi:hypothetical protein
MNVLVSARVHDKKKNVATANNGQKKTTRRARESAV